MFYPKFILFIIIVMACSCFDSNCSEFSKLFNRNKTSTTSTITTRNGLAGTLAYLAIKGSAATASFYGMSTTAMLGMSMLICALDHEHALWYMHPAATIGAFAGIYGVAKGWAAAEPCAIRARKYIDNNQSKWFLPIRI